MCDWLTDREAGNMASAKKKKKVIKKEHECGGGVKPDELLPLHLNFLKIIYRIYVIYFLNRQNKKKLFLDYVFQRGKLVKILFKRVKKRT